MDYISRQDTIKALSKHCESILQANVSYQTADIYRIATDHAIDVIKILPAADVPERNVGKWIDDTDERIGYIARCSACGEKVLYGVSFDFEGNRHQMNFCPNCGAKMEG